MHDYMVRATAAGARIRAFACTTKELVEEARKAHNTSPVVTAGLGRLLSAGCMMGSMLKGDYPDCEGRRSAAGTDSDG